MSAKKVYKKINKILENYPSVNESFFYNKFMDSWYDIVLQQPLKTKEFLQWLIDAITDSKDTQDGAGCDTTHFEKDLLNLKKLIKAVSLYG